MKIAILDYTIGEVIIKDVPKELEVLGGEDIFVEMGFNTKSSLFMIVNNDLPLSIDTKGWSGTLTLK